LSSLEAGIAMVRREAAAAAGGEARQLAGLAGQASTLLQRGAALMAAARAKAADTLRFLGEDVQAEPALSANEPRRMLGDLTAFLAELHRAHADSARMAVVLEVMERQQREEAAAAAAEAARQQAEQQATEGGEEAPGQGQQQQHGQQAAQACQPSRCEAPQQGPGG
jgi:hypothetical protein